MLVLADTSVWIQHLQGHLPRLRTLLLVDRVVVHPFVMGELALGKLHRREEVLSSLRSLPSSRLAEHEEVLDLIQRRRLAGRGIGWVDAHLLASTLLDGIKLWSLDRPLARVAAEAGVGALP